MESTRRRTRRESGRPRRRLFGLREHGQSLVELALIAPVFIILMLGVIDFGRVYFAYVSVTNGARTGADYASSDPTNLAGIKSAATAETSELLAQSATNPDVSVATGNDVQGNPYVDVTMTYTFDTIFPWPGLPDSFDLERTVRARAGQ